MINTITLTPHPLKALGAQLVALTYGDMIELAGQVRDYMVDTGVVDEAFVSVSAVAEALNNAGLATKSGDY